MATARRTTRAALLVLGLAVVTTPALAGEFDPGNSSLELQIGSGPTVVVPASGSDIQLSTFGQGNTSVLITGTVFGGGPFGPSTSLFGGLPPVSSVVVSSLFAITGAEFQDQVMNQTPFLDNIGTGFGLQGSIPALSGTAFISFGDRPSASFFASVGSVDRTQFACGGNTCTVGRLHTGSAVITGIQTPRVSVPGKGTGAILTLDPTVADQVRLFTTGGGFTSTGAGDTDFLSTVTVAGSASGLGTMAMVAPVRISMVAPIRIRTEGNFSLPGELRMNLSFVPEPETLLLQLSAAAGLLLVGRWKARNRR